MTLAADLGAREAGAGRQRRALRAHLHHRPGDHPRAGAARVCRRRAAGRRATSGRCSPPGGAGPWPAGSAWTSSCSTSATTTLAVGDEVVLFGPGDDGEPDRAGLGRGDRHDLLRDRHPGRARGFRGCTSAMPGLPGTCVTTVPMWGKRAAVVAGAAGVVAAGAAVGLAAERYAVGRSFRGAPTPRRTSRSASCAARDVPVVGTDGVALHVEVDGPLHGTGDAAGDRSCSATACALDLGQLALPAPGPADLADDGARLVFWDQRGHGRSGARAGRARDDRPARARPARRHRGDRAARADGAGRPLDGRHDDHGAGRAGARRCSASG